MIEADVKSPTDADLAAHGVKALAREGRKLARFPGGWIDSGSRPLLEIIELEFHISPAASSS